MQSCENLWGNTKGMHECKGPKSVKFIRGTCSLTAGMRGTISTVCEPAIMSIMF